MSFFSKKRLKPDNFILELTQHLHNEKLWGIEVNYNEKEIKNSHISEYNITLPPFYHEKNRYSFDCIEIKICNPYIFRSVLNQLNSFLKEKKDHQLIVLDIICNPSLFSNKLKDLLNSIEHFDSIQVIKNNSKSIISNPEDLKNLDILINSELPKEKNKINFQITFPISESRYANAIAEKSNIAEDNEPAKALIFNRF